MAEASKAPSNFAPAQTNLPVSTPTDLIPAWSGRLVYGYLPIGEAAGLGDENVWAFDGRNSERLTDFTSQERGASYTFHADRYSSMALEAGSFIGAKGFDEPGPSAVVDISTGTFQNITLPDAIWASSSLDWSWREGLVLYEHSESLFSYDLHSQQIRQLTFLSPNPHGPRFSPEVGKFAYSTGRAPDYSLELADLSTKTLYSLGTVTSTESPDLIWAPDATALAYVYWAGDICGINILDMESSVPSVLLEIEKGSRNCQAEWSPDSQRLVMWLRLHTGDRAANEFILVDRDGANAREIPTIDSPPESMSSVAWSQDGTKVVLVQQYMVGPGYSLRSAAYMVDVETQRSVQVFDVAGFVQALRWFDD